MEKFRYKNWKVYQESKLLFKDILSLYKELPRDIKYSLGDQLTRSTLSIALNIAEGSGKESDKEMVRYLEISAGSAYETLANLDILRDNGYLKNSRYLEYETRIADITSQIGGFKKKLSGK